MNKLYKHPKIIIIVCVALTAIFGWQLKDIKLNNNIRQYLPHQNASYKRLVKTEDTFGSMVTIGVSLETHEKSIITAKNINIISAIVKKLTALKNISKIEALTNIDYVYVQDGALVAEPLVPDSYSGTAEDNKAIAQRLNDWKQMYNRVVISDNGRATQMVISLDKKCTDEDKQEALNGIREIVTAETKNSNLDVKFFGDPVLSEDARTFMLSDLTRLIPLVVLVVLLSLFFSFNTLEGTFLPLITVLMSTTWTCGLMAIFHFTFTIVSSVIPVALIAVGSAYGIHVLTHYYVAIDDFTGELTKEKYFSIVTGSLKDVSTAVILAGITTVVGFISLITSPIVPLHSFAIFTALGVLFSLLTAMIFIPAALLLKPLSRVRTRSKKMAALTEKVKARRERRIKRLGGKTPNEAQGSTFYNIYHFFVGTRPRLIIFILVLVVLSIVGLNKLNVDTALVNYFPTTCKLRKDIAYVDKNFAGTNSIYLLISSKDGKKSMTRPEILKPVDDLQNYLTKKYSGIGKAVSFTTFIKRMNQVMHIPQTTNSIAESADTSDQSDSSGNLDSFADSSDAESSLDSFADTGSTGSSLDSFASTDSSDSTGLDSFASTDNTENSTTDVPAAQTPDYAAQLEKTMTVKEGLALLNKAYFDAGGKTATVEDMVDSLEKELNYNGRNYDEIPYDPSKYPVQNMDGLSDLVSQYLLLFSGSLDQFSDDPLNPKTIRVQIQLRSHSTNETGNIIKDAKDYASKYFPEGYTIQATGAGEMEYVMTKMVVSSQLMSLLFSLICVFIIIAIAFKSGWAGLLGSIPLALTIILNYMVMGFAGINLDLVTSIIASVAIGVGIDYTIHFLTTYKEERALSSDLEEVTRKTFRKSGHGIVTNAIAVGLGFLVLYFSKFIVLRYIGILVAIVMFTSSILAMTVIPGILNITDPKFMHPKAKDQKKD